MESPTSHRRRGPTALLLGLVLALPLARGLYRLGVPNVWLDEAATWYGITGSWRRLFDHALAGDDCGGFLYAAVLKPWTAVAGTSEVALRLPSVVFTVLLAAVVFAVGRRLWNDRAGLYAGLTVGLYPVVFLQSRQARCYALELLLYALALLGLVLLLQGRRRAGGALVAAAGSLLVVTHVYGIVALAGLAAVAAAAPLAARSPGAQPAEPGAAAARRVAGNLAPFAPPVLAFAAWMWAFWQGIERTRADFWLQGSVGRTYLGLVEYVAPVALAVAVLLWRARRDGAAPRGRRLAAAGVLLALPILAGPYVATLASRGEHHFVLERYFLPMAVLAALALGYLLARLPRPLALAAAAALLLASVAKPGSLRAFASDTPHGARSEELATYLEAVREPDEPLYVAPGYQQLVLAYYGVEGVPVGRWDCSGLPELWADLSARVRPGGRSGDAPRTVRIVHFNCRVPLRPPPRGAAVTRRSFGSLQLVELDLGGTAAGGARGSGGTRGSPRAARTRPDARGSGTR